MNDVPMTRMKRIAKNLSLDQQETEIFLLGAHKLYDLIERHAHAGEYAGEPKSIYVFEILQLLYKDE
jgi:hypothetical protein